jgi:hypothetical protein
MENKYENRSQHTDVCCLSQSTVLRRVVKLRSELWKLFSFKASGAWEACDERQLSADATNPSFKN